jgi:non-specific protein-tyrosine kinase
LFTVHWLKAEENAVGKLRRALDEAKKLRREETPNEKGEYSAQSGEPERPGWVSPTYTECCPMKLDPQKVSEKRCVSVVSEAPETEFYSVLRTRILHRTRENGWNTIMITSAVPGEGKTVTAINLAFSFAREFSQTVLLVDCDFRQQKVHQYLGLSSDSGLIDHLKYNKPIKDLLIWPGIEKLTLISGGKTVRDSAELLGSPKMKALVTEMKARYEDRYLFFDVPPVLVGADALAFAPLVDSILMVVDARTSIQDVLKALELVPEEKFLGFVLNRQQFQMKDYYGKYYGR